MGEAAGEADQLLEAELLGPAHQVSAELPGAARHEAGPVMSGKFKSRFFSDEEKYFSGKFKNNWINFFAPCFHLSSK